MSSEKKTCLIIDFEISDSQESIILDHAMRNTELGVAEGELYRIKNHFLREYPDYKITKAHLNMEKIIWEIHLEKIK